MPAWSAAGTTNLSSGERLEVLTATDSSGADGALQGFTFSPQPVSIALTIVNNSGEPVVLQASADNVTWLPVTSQGVAVSVATGIAETFTVSSGLYYRLSNATEITAGGTIWVAR
jgi:hypothetical protein